MPIFLALLPYLKKLEPCIQKFIAPFIAPFIWVSFFLLVYAYGHHNGSVACQAENKAAMQKAITVQQQAASLQQQKMNAAAFALSQTLDQERTKNKTIEGKLNAERQKRIYSDCVLPVDGVRLYNDTIAAH